MRCAHIVFKKRSPESLTKEAVLAGLQRFKELDDVCLEVRKAATAYSTFVTQSNKRHGQTKQTSETFAKLEVSMKTAQQKVLAVLVAEWSKFAQ